MKILIMAALPQEYAPLKQLIHPVYLIERRPFKKFFFELPDKTVVLVESGMGGVHAREALESEISRFKPDLAIFAGFAGGLHPDLSVAEVCVVRKATDVASDASYELLVPDRLFNYFDRNSIRIVSALTTPSPENKPSLAARAGNNLAVVDMETATVAETVLQRRIPFLCFRAISDAIGDELGFDLRDITDEHGGVKLIGVAKTILRNPLTIRSFYLSWRRSAKAANNLAGILYTLLRIPTAHLADLVSGIRVERS